MKDAVKPPLPCHPLLSHTCGQSWTYPALEAASWITITFSSHTLPPCLVGWKDRSWHPWANFRKICYLLISRLFSIKQLFFQATEVGGHCSLAPSDSPLPTADSTQRHPNEKYEDAGYSGGNLGHISP